MSHDTIIIARHGKPALSRKVQLTWREYREWWGQYDLGGILSMTRLSKPLYRLRILEI